MPASNDTMRIHVLFFAQAQELASSCETDIELPSDATVGHAVETLGETYPELRELLARCRFAINQEFSASADSLPPDCEFAVLPPMSGG